MLLRLYYFSTRNFQKLLSYNNVIFVKKILQAKMFTKLNNFKFQSLIFIMHSACVGIPSAFHLFI